MKFEDDKKSKKLPNSWSGNIKMISEKKLSILDTAILKNQGSIDLEVKKLKVNNDVNENHTRVKNETNSIVFYRFKR